MALTRLTNYAVGQWVEAPETGEILHTALRGEPGYIAGSEGLDFAAMMHYGREVGGRALRKRTFDDRGRMLKSLALYLLVRKEDFYNISAATGATRAGSWVDIE